MSRYAANTEVSSARSPQARFRDRQRQHRWAERERVMRTRPPKSLEDCIWAAGYFEGEGTVTLTSSGRYIRPVVAITSVDAFVVQWFQSTWGGHIKSHQPKGNARVAHTWTLNSGDVVEAFLDDIRFYIRRSNVARKIDLVIEDIRDRGPYQRDTSAQARSRERAAVIRRLNHRGTLPMLPPPGDDQ